VPTRSDERYLQADERFERGLRVALETARTLDVIWHAACLGVTKLVI